jgi:glutathione S-transferase
MMLSPWIALVTVAALLLYFYMGLQVGGARGKYGVKAPATSGNPDFERIFRVHMNTLEWLLIFLPALWIASGYWDPRIIAGIGVVWIIGRAMYMQGYIKAADQRSMGFMVQALATLVLIVGAAAGAVMALVQPT